MTAAITTEKAPAAGGHQREGEDQNPTKRTTLSNDSTKRAEARVERERDLMLAAETLHVPLQSVTPDTWATETSIDSPDADPMITHSHDYSLGPFNLVLSHMICDVDFGTDLIVKWDEPGVNASTPEEFAIAAARIPELISALSDAYSRWITASEEAA